MLITTNKTFIDLKIYELMNSFIKSEFLDDIKKEDFYNKTLTKYFSNIKIEDLNRNFLIMFFSNTKFESREMFIARRFVLYIIENINIAELNYLLYFKTQIYNKGFYLKTFLNLLKIDIEVLNSLNKNDLEKNTTKILNLLYINLNNIKFKDDEIKKSLSNFFYNIKKNNLLSIKVRYKNCSYAKAFIENIFCDISKENLNKDFIKDSLLKLKNSKLLKHTRVFIEILVSLVNDKLIIDNDLNRLLLNLYETEYSIKSNYLIDLFDKDISKYHVVEFKNKSNTLFFIDINSEEITDTALSYLNTFKKSEPTLKYLFENFNESLGNYKNQVKTIDDLNFKIFKEQLYFFKNNYTAANYLVRFYIFIKEHYDEYIFKNENINPMVLYRTDITPIILSGFEIINHNPFEDVPKSDKWILFSNNEMNSNLLDFKGKKFDFTKIKEKKYRDYCKHFIWMNTSVVDRKCSHLFNLTYFFNFIIDLKTGKKIYLYAKPTDDLTFKISELYAYKNQLKKIYNTNRSINQAMSSVKLMLKHINYHFEEINPSLFYCLSCIYVKKDLSNAKVIPDDELNKLSNLMAENSKYSVENAIYHAIFYLGLTTEFRISQIVSLKKNCIRETNKKNEYVLISKSKVSQNEIIEQPITIYTKKQLDEIIALTQKYRNDERIDDSIKDYLFLYESRLRKHIDIMSSHLFNNYLHKCCEKLNLPKYNFENLRDTHMTKAEEFIIRNSMSEMNQKVLTGHKNITTTKKHYINTNITEMLEAVHGVLIGNVDLDVESQTKISLSEEIERKENEVSNGCGYCSTNSCNNLTYLDCVLCQYFVTTVDKIPFFQDQIKILDEKIKNANIKHDKEDLINIKKILLKYLEKLFTLKNNKTKMEGEI